MVIHVTNENYEKEVKQSDIPVVIDFWAEWCMPCKMFGPIFEEAGKEMEGTVKFVKISTEDAPDIAQEFKVMSIPTIVFMKDGKEVDRAMGMMAKDALLEKVKSL
ncbi:MAG: thioredoxin [Candidatus Woesearchaeota archaeon]